VSRFAAVCLGGVVAAAAQADDTRIPLVAGLVLVGATHQDAGDLERVTRVSRAGAEGSTVVERLRLTAPAKGQAQWLEKNREVSAADQSTARSLHWAYAASDPDAFPGHTDLGASAAVLQDLDSQGKSAFGMVESLGAVGFAAALSTSTARQELKGHLKRVGAGPEPFPLLLNGRRVTVPAVHAKGYLEAEGGNGIQAEFWFLDEPDNAIALRESDDDGGNFQVVRVDFPAADPQLAALAQSCRAELHGVYFDTGSAELLPVSAEALRRAAALLKANPSWLVTVEGHTDNIGGADANLDLSNRRAAAVREALVKSGVPAARLGVKGYGLARPVESNDNLEGRAHNRRVELSRTCN
jgi:outer membrane protein OmpA-like peptidoglycan-associated protein